MMYSVNTVKTSSNAIRHPDPKIFMELRNAGLTNAEIARKTGFNHGTVLRYIGLQPKKLTLAIRKQEQASRAAREAVRENYAESVKQENNNTIKTTPAVRVSSSESCYLEKACAVVKRHEERMAHARKLSELVNQARRVLSEAQENMKNAEQVCKDAQLNLNKAIEESRKAENTLACSRFIYACAAEYVKSYSRGNAPTASL